MDRSWLELVEAAARRPLGVGTLFPTSRALAGRLVAAVEHAPEGPVVELGAGAGAITGLLVRRPQGPVLAFERDPELARYTAARFPRVCVWNAPAESLTEHLRPGSVAAVVASLPWSVMPPLSRERILYAVRGALMPGGVFATYLCLHVRANAGGRSFVQRLHAHFERVEAGPVEWWNLPPAQVFVARV